METQQTVLAALADAEPTTEEEAKAKNYIEDFVRRQSAYWSRKTLEGHLTASAWITNEKADKAVLLHHRKLDIWVQPGGHIDDEDSSLIEASLREASEETGLKNLRLRQPGIFDLDVHAIPARKNEPEHLHLDVRFWWVADDTRLIISDESNELEWLSADEIRKLTDEESVLRMVRKSMV